MIYMNNKYLIVLLTCLFSSCIYHPKIKNIPLMEEKNELQISAGIAPTSIFATVNYAPFNHFAIAAHADYLSHNLRSGSFNFGYFNKFKNNYIYEVYVGYEIGEGYSDNINNARDDFNSHYSDNTYQAYSLTANIGKRSNKKKNLEFGLSNHFFYLHSAGIYYQHDQVGYLIDIKDEAIAYEPHIFIKAGGERLKFHAQASYTFMYKYTNTWADDAGYYFPLNFGIGLTYRFNTKKKQKE